MRWPSATPAGKRTLIVRVLVTPPVPRHSVHFSSTIVPAPWHSRHGSEKLNEPWLREIRPLPWHCGQVRGVVPGLAPLPWQVSHSPADRSVSGSVVPRTAWGKSRVTSVSTSRPRRGPRRAAPPPGPPPEKIELKMSEKPAPPKRRSPAPPCAPALENPPNRSDGSNCWLPERAPRRNAPEPNSERISSYSLRFLSSESTSYASEAALNFSSASRLSGFRSGCRSRASLRYAFLISSVEADLFTPSTA